MRAAVLLLVVGLQAAAAFLVPRAPTSPAPMTTTARRRPSAAASTSSLVRRHFTVGGEAPDGPTLQETFNAATAIAAAIVGGLVGLEIYQERPRGWVNEQLVEAAPSTLGPYAGRGLFATADIPAGTVLGEYPGVIYPKAAWLARKMNSEEAVVLASRYAWTLEGGDKVLDPTLPNGELPERVVALGGLISKPTLLALVNEPPAGVDVNLVPEVSQAAVAFVADRDIFKGEELWIDYGLNYDRRHYRRR